MDTDAVGGCRKVGQSGGSSSSSPSPSALRSVGDGREEFLPSRRLDRPQRILSMQGPPVLFALRPCSTQEEGQGACVGWGLFKGSGPSGELIDF